MMVTLQSRSTISTILLIRMGIRFISGFRKQGEPHTIAIQNSQHFVSQKLMVTDMDEVLDMGCGIGGPLRGWFETLEPGYWIDQSINIKSICAREITKGLSPWMQKRCFSSVGLPRRKRNEGGFYDSFLHGVKSSL